MGFLVELNGFERISVSIHNLGPFLTKFLLSKHIEFGDGELSVLLRHWQQLNFAQSYFLFSVSPLVAAVAAVADSTILLDILHFIKESDMSGISTFGRPLKACQGADTSQTEWL